MSSVKYRISNKKFSCNKNINNKKIENLNLIFYLVKIKNNEQTIYIIEKNIKFI